MSILQLPIHPALRHSSRLQRTEHADERIRSWEWVCLVVAGSVAAAASILMDFHLKIPGHAILRSVFPMTVGLALVPRRGAGTVMACSAIVTAVGIRLIGPMDGGSSLGAMTSLTATGPLLDWSLRRAGSGWTLYTRFAFAGMASNLLALAVRAGAKILPWAHASGKPLAAWLPTAAVTYVLCGIVAGLLSGAIWFAARGDEEQE